MTRWEKSYRVQALCRARNRLVARAVQATELGAAQIDKHLAAAAELSPEGFQALRCVPQHVEMILIERELVMLCGG